MSNAVPAERRHTLTARERAVLACHGTAALALVPAYLWLTPTSRWDEPLLLAVLLALAIVAIFHDVPLPSGISFDATAALALIAVALVGPLPALAVIFPPIAVNALCGRERLLRAGNLANLAAYGWYTLAGALLLQGVAPEPTGPQAFAWLFVAGLVQLLVNWVVGPAVYGTLWLGHPLRALVEMLRDAPARRRGDGGARRADGRALRLVRPARAGALRARRRAAAERAHVSSPARARSRCSTRSPRPAATRTRWPCTSRLGRAERRELDAVIRLAHARAVSGDPGEHLGHTVVDWSEVSCAAGHVTEWWNGAGGPAGRARRDHPAVGPDRRGRAHVGGADRRGQPAARPPRRARAARRARPACGSTRRVVRAARAVVAQERLSPAVPAPEPRLHRLRVPHGCGARSPRASSAARPAPRRACSAWPATSCCCCAGAIRSRLRGLGAARRRRRARRVVERPRGASCARRRGSRPAS